MSSSSGNTIGPIEALRLVPPQILRLLIANSKPNKAIDFDTGMGLVILADEFERLCTRDFDDEMNDENISRRKLVQVEDAKAALRLSMVEPGEIAKATSVSFRHLALLAQTKSDDDAVWQNLIETGAIKEPTKQLQDRLERMRYWISSEHFPEEMRINILSSPNVQALSQLNDEEKSALIGLTDALRDCQWDAESIGSAIPQSAKDMGLSPRSAYRAAYAALMGLEKGPRLAPILAEMDKNEILMQLDSCCQEQ